MIFFREMEAARLAAQTSANRAGAPRFILRTEVRKGWLVVFDCPALETHFVIHPAAAVGKPQDKAGAAT